MPLRLLLLSFLLGLSAQAQLITTIAGKDWIFPASTLAARSAPLGKVRGVAVDRANNVYIADPDNNMVMRVSTAGVLSVFAGNGQNKRSGDGGPALNAGVPSPSYVSVDNSGKVYILDSSGVRIVTPDGIINFVSGIGAGVLSSVIAVDPTGNIYLAQTSIGTTLSTKFSRIAPDGTITQIQVGTSVNLPQAMSIDADGNIYVVDTSRRLLKITNGSVAQVTDLSRVDTFPAGVSNIISYGSANPLSIDSSGNVYYCGRISSSVFKIDPAGAVTTIAGNLTIGFSGDGGSATAASFNQPASIALDSLGNAYIADSGNSRVRKVVKNGSIDTFAGNNSFQFSGDGGPSSSASLHYPSGVAIDSDGNLFITSASYQGAAGNGRIRKIAADGTITTVAGNGIPGFSGDGGPAVNASLNDPEDVAVDANGNLFIADSDGNRVRKVTRSGIISTLAGSGLSGFSGDGGPATAAKLSGPHGVAVDAAGNVYIADTGNGRIRRVTADGLIQTVAGSTGNSSLGDGGPALAARLSSPWGVALDSNGNMFIADTANQRIRKVTTDGNITTVAGSGPLGYSGDGGPATSAKLNAPVHVAADANGNLFIADATNNVIRRVATDGSISTAAGNGKSGFDGDGGLATAAMLYSPRGIAIDRAGNLLIGDTFNDRIRKVLATATTFSAAPAALTFSAISGAALPAAASVNLSSLVPGLAFKATTNVGWLSVTPNAGTMPATIQVNADQTTLTPGTYHGVITIAAAAAVPPSIDIAVDLTVLATAPAQLSVDTRTLSFNALQGSGVQTQQLRVANSGGGTLTFQARATTQSGGTWLSVTPGSGTAAPASPAALTVNVSPDGLPPGVYRGTIAILGGSTPGPVSAITLDVTLTVAKPTAVILTSLSGVTFQSVAQGGTPLPQNFGILNVGQGTLSWTASATTLSGGANWLRVSPLNGTVQRPYLDVNLIDISVDQTGLAPGDYYGRIQITASAINSPQIVSVLLTVLPPGASPGMEVRPAGLIFTGTAGTSPGSQDVTLGNPKPRQDSFLSGSIGRGFTYLPTSADVLPSQPLPLRVFPDFSTLEAGSIQKGTITLQFANDEPRTITVLTVVAPKSSAGSSEGPQPRAPNCPSPNLQLVIRSLRPNFTAIAGQTTTVEVQVTDECGNLVGPDSSAPGAVQVTFSNGDTALNLTHTGNGIWSGSWRPVNTKSNAVTVLVTAFQVQGTATKQNQLSISGTLSSGGTTPLVTAGGVVQGASFAAGVPVAPGSLITIYGTNLAGGSGAATALPFPQILNGAQVRLGDRALPLLYTSGGQLNVQVPFDVPVNTQYQVTVQRDNVLSVPESLVLAAAQPGIFTLNQQGTGQGAITKSDLVTIAGPENPAKAGDTVVIYCTGLGAVTPAVPAGSPAPASTLSKTDNPVTVTIGGITAQTSFSGLAPGFAGLYQVNAVIPTGITPGNNVPVVLTVAGQDSPPATMAIR